MSKTKDSAVKKLFVDDNEDSSSLVLSEDSGDEGLGRIKKDIVRNKRFSVMINYDEKDVPILNVIPSSWRYETKLGDEQGDHVIAYCLIIESVASFGGGDIKKIPQLFYEFVRNVIPEYSDDFEDSKTKIEEKLNEFRVVRKNATAGLRSGGFDVDSVKKSLKKSEIELVARHLEGVADKFVEALNSLEDASFSRFRKEGISESLSKEVALMTINSFKEEEGKDYEEFCKVIEKAIEDGDDHKKIAETLTNFKTPDSIERSKKSVVKQAVTLKSVENFLEKIYPKARYHEGSAMKALRAWSEKIIHDDDIITAKDAIEIGKKCSALFDYRYTKKTEDAEDSSKGSAKKLKAKKGETKEEAGERFFKINKDNEDTFCKAVARLIILVFSAFRGLNELEFSLKNDLYSSFLKQILMDQYWILHKVKNENGEEENLNVTTLKAKISEHASLDFVNNKFRMINKNRFIVENSGKSINEKIDFALTQWREGVEGKKNISSFDYKFLLNFFTEKKDSLTITQKEEITNIVFKTLKSKSQKFNEDCENLFSFFVEKEVVDCDACFGEDSLLIMAGFAGYRKTVNNILAKCSDETLNKKCTKGASALMLTMNHLWHDESCDIIKRSNAESLESVYEYKDEKIKIEDLIKRFSEKTERDDLTNLIDKIKKKSDFSMKELVHAINKIDSPSPVISDLQSSKKISSNSASK